MRAVRACKGAKLGVQGGASAYSSGNLCTYYTYRMPAELLGHVVKVDEHGHVPVAVAQVLLEVACLAVVKVRLVPGTCGAAASAAWGLRSGLRPLLCSACGA